MILPCIPDEEVTVQKSCTFKCVTDQSKIHVFRLKASASYVGSALLQRAYTEKVELLELPQYVSL